MTLRTLLAGGAVAACLSLPLQAADPESGTLTMDSGPLEFTGGPFAAANVFGQVGDPQCLEPAFPCDFFALTVDLPEDYIQTFPSALVRITVAVDDPGANVREDYDIYLYDESGALVAEGVSESDPEVISLLAENGVREFELQIVPFTATASTYLGRVELLPGEPVDPRQARSMALREAGGAAGGLLLALAAFAGLRRRRH